MSSAFKHASTVAEVANVQADGQHEVKTHFLKAGVHFQRSLASGQTRSHTYTTNIASTDVKEQ